MKTIVNKGLIFFIVLICMLSCREENLHPIPDPDQLVAGRLSGTWANPSNIVTPEGVPPEVFGAMRLVFTTDENGYPNKFLAQECPIIFTGVDGTWSISGTENDASVTLTNVSPVDEFKAQITNTSLIITFHMGWENTETGETGRGDFSVTLARK